MISKIEEMFTNPEKVSQENVYALIREAAQVVDDLKIRLASSEESIREQAKKDALQMQTELKKQMERTRSSLGQSQIGNFLAVAGADAQSKSDVFKQALRNLQTGLIGKPKQKKKPRRVKEWLAS